MNLDLVCCLGPSKALGAIIFMQVLPALVMLTHRIAVAVLVRFIGRMRRRPVARDSPKRHVADYARGKLAPRSGGQERVKHGQAAAQ